MEDAEWLISVIADETDTDQLASLQAEQTDLKAQIAALQRRTKALAKV